MLIMKGVYAMITMVCINKTWDDRGVSVAYVLKDSTGKVTTYRPEKLMDALRNKTVRVTNLKLSSQGNIVERVQYAETAKSIIEQQTRTHSVETIPTGCCNDDA